MSTIGLYTTFNLKSILKFLKINIIHGIFRVLNLCHILCVYFFGGEMHLFSSSSPSSSETEDCFSKFPLRFPLQNICRDSVKKKEGPVGRHLHSRITFSPLV